jgi:hypothetical protein
LNRHLEAEIAEIRVAVAPTGFRRMVPPSWWSVSKPFSLVAVDDMAEEEVESTSLRQQLLSSESLRCSSCWPAVMISCCCQLWMTVAGWKKMAKSEFFRLRSLTRLLMR